MSENYLSKDKLDILYNKVIECAFLAKRMQGDISREFKKDGSVLTKADLQISSLIISTINSLFPTCNVISEETVTKFNKKAPFTFVLDPIDGTDVYSQGFPSFAVALGILDNKRKPVGSMIVAPRFGIGKEELLIRLDPGSTLLVDNKPFNIKVNKDTPNQITISSKIQQKLNFKHFDGKTRTFGSSIIQILSPLIFSNIDGCINQEAYAWDVAASHAILEHANLKIMFNDKSELIYDDNLLIDRKPCRGIIYCGSVKCIEKMIERIPVQ